MNEVRALGVAVIEGPHVFGRLEVSEESFFYPLMNVGDLFRRDRVRISKAPVMDERSVFGQQKHRIRGHFPATFSVPRSFLLCISGSPPVSVTTCAQIFVGTHKTHYFLHNADCGWGWWYCDDLLSQPRASRKRGGATYSSCSSRHIGTTTEGASQPVFTSPLLRSFFLLLVGHQPLGGSSGAGNGITLGLCSQERRSHVDPKPALVVRREVMWKAVGILPGVREI